MPLITRDGFYLKLGSLTTGSGFAYGAGYRTAALPAPRRGLRRLGRCVVQGLLGRRGAGADCRELADGRMMLEG